MLPILVLVLPITTLVILRDEAPVTELLYARREWSAAVERTGPWAGDLEPAWALLDSSQASLERQFARMPLLRRFGHTRALIEAARDSTAAGEQRATERRRGHRDAMEARVSDLSRSLVEARSFLAVLETDRDALNAIVSAETHLAAARGLIDADRSTEVEQMLAQAESEVVRSSLHLNRRLDQFLSRRASWDEWNDEMLRISRASESPVILVDKLNRTCFVLELGSVRDSFPMEMGPNWMSRKLYSGDKATPEGRYEVVQLKTGGQTIYYKAALINYPNPADRERYDRGRRSGRVPAGSGIGGLIQIHGKGGRGSDWTLGCVSLADGDMDRLMQFLRVGTPVYIVGFWREPSWLVRFVEEGQHASSLRGLQDVRRAR